MSWGCETSYAAERRLLSVCGFLLGLLFAGAACASPQGGAVVGGHGTIHRPDAHHTIVDQRSSSLAIDWRSFNLGHDDVVRFRQPSSSAAALNRILDQDPSTILGTIDANGRVFLINPNGLIFGRGAHVNVGSLVAGTLDIAPEDFMRGDYRFQTPVGTAPGVVINRGLIAAATGGSVTLMGGAVANQGLILARYGHVNLGAGRAATLDFNGDGLLRFRIDEGVLANARGLSAAVSNSGTIDADGGQVLLTGRQSRQVFSRVVNNRGVIRAGRIQQQGGVIRLVAGPAGSVVNTGTLDASARSAADQGGTIVVSAGTITQSGAIHADGSGGGSVSLGAVDTVTLGGDSVTSAHGTTGEGGSVRVLGDTVTLADRAAVDVSGGAGGGTVLVGGDFHGAGSTPTAARTSVAAGARIRADALSAGDGGRVAVWSDDATRFSGHVSARGAGAGGEGGFVEVSGKRNLGFTGMVDVGAAQGSSGTLLLDPDDITIVDSGAADDDACTSSDCTVLQGDGAGTPYTISNDAIEASTADIVLQATNDFTQNADAPINLTQDGQSLTVQAGGNITVKAAITTSNGAIRLEADSPEIAGDGNGRLELANNVSLQSNGGAITLIGADFDFRSGSSIDAGIGTINVARSGTTLSSPFSIGMNSDALSATDFGRLKTTGTMTIGQADTAGSDGAGTNAQTITNSLSIDADLTLEQGSVTFAGPVTSLAADISTAGGAVTFADAVTLGEGVAVDTTGDSTNSGAIAFDGAITGASHSLVLNAGAGVVELAAVGDTTAVNSLTVTTTGATTLNGDILTDGGAVSFSGPVKLSAASVEVDTTNAGKATSAGNITFSGAVTGTSKSLALKAGSGAVSLTGAGASGAALAGLDLSGGVLTLAGDVYSDALSLAGTALHLGGDLHAGSALDFTKAGPITLDSDVTVDTAAAHGAQDFSTTTIDGTHALSLEAGGGAVTLGSVGATAAVRGLIVATTGATTLNGDIHSGGAVDLSGAIGAIQLNAGSIQAGAAVSFNGEVTLGGPGPVAIDSGNGNITFHGALKGTGKNLTLNAGTGGLSLAEVGATGSALGGLSLTGGALSLGGNVYAASLDLSGTSLALGGDLHIGGDLDFGNAGPVTLIDEVTVDTAAANGAQDFSGVAIDGLHALDLEAGSGAVTLGSVGGTEKLSGLTVATIGTTTLGGNIASTGKIDLSDATGAIQLDAGNIQAGTAVSFGGAVTLGADSGITAQGITFDKDVSGGFELTLDGGSGSVNLATVGAGGALESLDVKGAAILNGNILTDGGAVTFGGPVKLGAATVEVDTTNAGKATSVGNITFSGAVTGTGKSLALKAGSGAVSLAGAGASGAALAGLDLSGGVLTLAGDVYSDALSLAGSATRLGGDLHVGSALDFTKAGPITLNSDVTVDTAAANGAQDFSATTIDGTHALSLEAGGGAVTLGSAGATAAVDNLTVITSGAMTLGGNITSNGAVNLAGATGPIALDGGQIDADGPISFGGPVMLGSDAIIKGDDIDFKFDVSGPHALILNGGGGGVSLSSVGSTATVNSLTVATTGNTLLKGGITSSGNLDLANATGPIELHGGHVHAGGTALFGGPVTLAGDTIIDGNTIRFASDVSGGHALTLNGGGDVSLSSAGTGDDLSSLTINAGSDVHLGGDVHAGGGIRFNGPLVLDNTVTITGGAIDFANAIDAVVTDQQGLTLNGGSGGVTIDGPVGAKQRLAFLRVNGAGSITFNGDIATAGALDLPSASGTTALNLAQITAGGPVKFGGPVVLGHDLAVTASDAAVKLGGPITAGGGHKLSLDAGAGALSLHAAGTASDPLGGLTLVGGSLALAGDIFARGGLDFSDVGAVAIAAPVALGTSVDGGSLSFGTTPLDGPGALALRTGGGDVALAAVGESRPLGALTISGGGTNTLNGPVHVSGSIDIDGASRLNGGSIITDDGQIKLNGPLDLGADTSMSSHGGSLLLGDAPVSGANRRLSLDAGGGNVTLGPVGTVSDPLTQFSVTGAGQLDLTGDLVTRGAVDLRANRGVSQAGDIDSGGGDVRLTTANGDITMNAGTTTRTHGGDIDYTADGGNVVLGQLDADTGNVVVNARGGDIVSNGASPNVIATTASLSALGAIGEHDQPIRFAVPDNGRITLTLGAAAAYISSNSAAPVVSDSPVVNVAGQILSGAEKGQVASLTDLGYVDWSAFSPDLRLFGITGSGILLPPDQREE